jgi:hypothetical protein
MTEKQQSSGTRTGPIVSSRDVSTPGSQVRVTAYTLSAQATRNLELPGPLPRFAADSTPPQAQACAPGARR